MKRMIEMLRADTNAGRLLFLEKVNPDERCAGPGIRRTDSGLGGTR
jgi:hypothetical protein